MRRCRKKLRSTRCCKRLDVWLGFADEELIPLTPNYTFIMKAHRILAIALTLFIGQGAHARAQTAGQPAPRKSAAQIWPTVTQAQSEAEYPEEWKAQHRAGAAIAANAWVLKVP